MSASIEIESQGEHQYVVRLRDGEQVGESWFSVTPGVLDEVSATAGDEESVVRRTAEFLAARQDVADYPAVVELEDVIATYDDCHLHHRLNDVSPGISPAARLPRAP